MLAFLLYSHSHVLNIVSVTYTYWQIRHVYSKDRWSLVGRRRTYYIVAASFSSLFPDVDRNKPSSDIAATIPSVETIVNVSTSKRSQHCVRKVRRGSQMISITYVEHRAMVNNHTAVVTAFGVLNSQICSFANLCVLLCPPPLSYHP